MERVPVSSSNIVSIGYDPTNKTLEVEFKGGGLYHYHDVDPSVHAGLLRAPSIGKHLNTHIKEKHRYTKIINL
jgi:KTSC domain-containing protein